MDKVANVVKALLVDFDVDEAKNLEEASVLELPYQSGHDLLTCLAIFYSQLFQVIGLGFLEKRQHLSQRVLHEDVPLVDDLLELYELLCAFENIAELLVINARVIEDDAIDVHHVEELACTSQSLGVAYTQRVVLQAQRLLVHVIQNWKHHLTCVCADLKVLKFGVVGMSLFDALHVTLPEQLKVMDLLFDVFGDLFEHVVLLGHVAVKLLFVVGGESLREGELFFFLFFLGLFFDSCKHFLGSEADSFLFIGRHAHEEANVGVELLAVSSRLQQGPSTADHCFGSITSSVVFKLKHANYFAILANAVKHFVDDGLGTQELGAQDLVGFAVHPLQIQKWLLFHFFLRPFLSCLS